MFSRATKCAITSLREKTRIGTENTSYNRFSIQGKIINGKMVAMLITLGRMQSKFYSGNY